MGYSWILYTTCSQKDARRVVQDVYAELERIVGADIVALSEDDEYPEELGQWPSFEVRGTSIPTPAEERALLQEPNKIGVSFEEAALARLQTCKSRIEIERPTSFEDDPTLVTAMVLLLRGVGPSVFCKNRGFDLTTSETLFTQLEDEHDLHAALEESREDEESGDTLEESDATTPEAIHRLLQAIAEHPPARRRVGELLESAGANVQKYIRYLGQNGPTTDAKVAAALSLDVKIVATARHALAELLERAERR